MSLFNTTHVHLFQEELNDIRVKSSYCVFYCHGFSLHVSSVYFVSLCNQSNSGGEYSINDLYISVPSCVRETQVGIFCGLF